MTDEVPAHDVTERDAHPLAYVVALVVYVALGYWLRSAILNWIVGPLFLLIVLSVVPRLVRKRR
jgi:hypothetical protein